MVWRVGEPQDLLKKLRAEILKKSLEVTKMALGVAQEQLDTVATIPILANIGLAYTNMSDLKQSLY
ncbi:MAG: hypothetical protein R2813_03525 [Flavobacteriales bacterium]